MEKGITNGRRTKDDRTKGNRMNKKRLIFTALIAAILRSGGCDLCRRLVREIWREI